MNMSSCELTSCLQKTESGSHKVVEGNVIKSYELLKLWNNFQSRMDFKLPEKIKLEKKCKFDHLLYILRFVSGVAVMHCAHEDGDGEAGGGDGKKTAR